MIHYLKLFIYFTFISVSVAANSQVFSQNGRFSIDYDQGCTPTTVRITQRLLLDQPRSFQFLNGAEFVSDTSFTYTSPGTYRIVQLNEGSVVPQTDTLLFTLNSSPNPVFEIYSCRNDEVEVSITESQYDFYRIYYNSTDSVNYSPGEANPQIQLQSSSEQISVKGFYNDAFNASCGITRKSIQIQPALLPLVIDSAYFSKNCSGSFSLKTITQSPLDNQYAIIIADENTSLEIFRGALEAVSSTFEDIPLENDLEKCITINTIDPCNGEVVSSEPYCITPNFNEIENFNGAYASYNGENILLNFGNVKEDTVLIKRRSGRSNFIKIKEVLGASTLDPINASRYYEYEISFAENNCDTVNFSSVISPPFIKIATKDQLSNSITLEVTPPTNNILQEASIELLLYSDDSTEVHKENYLNSFRLVPSLGEFQNIRLIYNYPSSDQLVYSNVIRTRINYIIHVPKAFTPFNNDGLNDTLLFYGIPTDNASLQIYNRWGELIYESNDANAGWDGTNRQGKSPQGTFRYKISYEIPSGELKTQVGTFVLIRK